MPMMLRLLILPAFVFGTNAVKHEDEGHPPSKNENHHRGDTHQMAALGHNVQEGVVDGQHEHHDEQYELW